MATHREQFELILYEPPEPGDRLVMFITLARYGDGRPEVGVYPLAVPHIERWANPFYASVQTFEGDTTRAWVSVKGEVTITASSPERITGSFEFTGIVARPSKDLYYRTDDFIRLDPDAPRIEVVGSFSVPRYEEPGLFNVGVR